MWFVTHYPSNRRSDTKPRFYALGLLAVLAVLLPSVTTFAALVTTDRYIVSVDDTVTEDQYVTATSGKIEGVIVGDLTIFTGSLTITGNVTGSVTVFTVGSVTIAEGATVGGSLRGSAGTVRVAGAVGDDVFIGAVSVVVDPSGEVGRDVIGFGGALTIRGDVGRDVRGRTMRTEISGSVGGDVDIATQGLDITPTASVGGDVLYRSPSEADINDAAQVTGTITRLPSRGNFIYGVILSLATVISFLGFVVAGIVSLWVLRTSSSRAVGAVLRKPIRSFLAGLVTVIVLPAAVIILAMTLVGLPLAAVGVFVGAIAFIIGPVPVVTALGNRVLINRGGLFGAFVVGAVLWRLGIWLIPVVGGFLYLIALVWGIGAWVLGLAAARRGDPTPPALLPASMVAVEEIPADWEPPLAPQPPTPTMSIPAAGGDAEEQSEPVTQPAPEPEPMATPVPESVDEDEDEPPETSDSWGLPTQ
jgi:hypothetical protein